MEEKLYRTNKEILGSYAKWITSQSPYIKDISPALKKVDEALKARKDNKMDVVKFDDEDELLLFINSTMDIPEIADLNVSEMDRRGEKTPYILITSRYGTPKPEYDFVDLYALSRNIYRDLLK